MLSHLRKLGRKQAKVVTRKARKDASPRTIQQFKAEGSTVVIVELMHVNVRGRSHHDGDD